MKFPECTDQSYKTLIIDLLPPNGFSAWFATGHQEGHKNNCQQILIGPTNGIEPKEMEMPAIQNIEKQLAIFGKRSR